MFRKTDISNILTNFLQEFHTSSKLRLLGHRGRGKRPSFAVEARESVHIRRHATCVLHVGLGRYVWQQLAAIQLKPLKPKLKLVMSSRIKKRPIQSSAGSLLLKPDTLAVAICSTPSSIFSSPRTVFHQLCIRGP